MEVRTVLYLFLQLTIEYQQIVTRSTWKYLYYPNDVNLSIRFHRVAEYLPTAVYVEITVQARTNNVYPVEGDVCANRAASSKSFSLSLEQQQRRTWKIVPRLQTPAQLLGCVTHATIRGVQSVYIVYKIHRAPCAATRCAASP